MNVLIPDFGIGNLASIVRMLEKAGHSGTVVSNPAALKLAEKIILPGVGAFDAGMQALARGNWREALDEAALVRRIPVLGICLGMQMLCNGSEEGGEKGLGWIDADVIRFRPPAGMRLRVPHMGWNTLHVPRENPILPFDDEERRFYFVHSFRVRCNRKEDAIGLTEYGETFVAAFQAENIFGVQFHPEKSHRFGMDLLRRYMEF